MIKRLLIANRGEIAIRIARAAAEMNLAAVAVHSQDDAASRHSQAADTAFALPGTGPAAYLDVAGMIAAARRTGCDAIHPGYGFLAENADFAHACAEAGLLFVGPSPRALALFGDKAAARALAHRLGVPVLAGTGILDEAGAAAFLAERGAIMLKAVAGGGGRGMRKVVRPEDLAEAFARCASEARAAFGNGDLYAEEFLADARHVEVQIAGDGAVAIHLHDRECSLQRQRQKLIEIAPAIGVPQSLREALFRAALDLAQAAEYQGLGTFEFLVQPQQGRFAFLEANARIQVEHTVTEQVLGLDLVRLQLQLAAGRTLTDLDLSQDRVPAPRGVALQARVNLETMQADGTARPGGGTITAYEPPSGPGVRVDGYGAVGYRTNPRFDSLLAKVIVHTGTGHVVDAAARARRALDEFRLEGVPHNIAFLTALLGHPALPAGRIHTGFVDEHIADLLAAMPVPPAAAPTAIRDDDPLAVLAAETSMRAGMGAVAPPGTETVPAPLQGTVVALSVGEGEGVRAGQTILVLEAMKMEHTIAAPFPGHVRGFAVAPGQTVFEGEALAFVEPGDVHDMGAVTVEQVDLDRVRPDLAELRARKRFTEDAARPDAVEKRRKTGQRTARENIEDLCDAGSFTEFGSLVVAGQMRRRSVKDLIERTPGDGLVCGLGRVNGDTFDDARARVIAISYDYTVLAGTQGMRNHMKTDRMLQLAEQWRLPIVFFTEGGGGRPGDTDMMSAGGLTVTTFHQYARLSGLVPLVGINSGYCFAGNAALLGCCDVIIATRNSSIGMGGPAMIEGGGLGVFHPKDVGPVSVQAPNGVIDLVVEDEAAAVAAAKKYLSYFQGPVAAWSCADQRLLRGAIPENRLRVYDIRALIDTLADEDTVLELRRDFGAGMVTAFARIEGRPIGIVANNPKHLGGAIDRDGADKASRFLQLCEAFDVPVLMLCDTPGNMVGPEAEKTALVRHNSRLFLIGANLSVPLFTVILRKGYGLGAQGMAGGSFVAPFFTVSWPTGEFGGMGLEGAVKLGQRNELAAIADPVERKAKYEEMVAKMYERGKALSAVMMQEFDEVIDPADTRRWIVAGLRAVPPAPPREGKKLRWVDAW